MLWQISDAATVEITGRSPEPAFGTSGTPMSSFSVVVLPAPLGRETEDFCRLLREWRWSRAAGACARSQPHSLRQPLWVASAVMGGGISAYLAPSS